MFPILQVGPVALPIPALVLLAGIWIGMSLTERHASKFGLRSTDIYNLIFIALVSWVVGGRLGYVIEYYEFFLKSPIDLFSRNLSLFNFWLAGLCALVVTLIYCQRKNLQVWNVLDALSPFFAVLLLSQAISHLASGVAFGSPSNLPWAIELWGEKRHPTQGIEIILAGIILWLVWPGKGYFWSNQPGRTFLTFLSLSAGAAIFLETFRGDSTLIFSGLRSRQVIAWLVLLASLYGLYHQARSPESDSH